MHVIILICLKTNFKFVKKLLIGHMRCYEQRNINKDGKVIYFSYVVIFFVKSWNL